MNAFDDAVLSLVNSLALRSWTFDIAVKELSSNNLLKGGAVMALVWAVWFLGSKDQVKNRYHVVCSLVAGFAALFVARFLALALPFRPRPIHVPELSFQLPYTMRRTPFEGQSSFPSDHAALFFAIAVGLIPVSPRLGGIAIAYVAGFICLPRIYLGLHYPTDVLAGAVIGIAAAILVARSTWLHRLIVDRCLTWETRYSAVFYTCFFLLTFQLATLFKDARVIATLLKGVFLHDLPVLD